jgi:hypothetical protein
MLRMPDRTLYNREIPKAKFYKQIEVDTTLKRKFIDEIERITWKYKLSRDTVNLEPSNGVEEIQIFEINLKGKYISIEVLENIDRVIPYPILYLLKYNGDVKLAIAYKERNKVDENRMVVHSYYQSGWVKEDEIEIDVLRGLDLKDVYDNLIRQLIPIESTVGDDIEELMQLTKVQERLCKEILNLEKDLKREKQFNKKVDLNIALQKKRTELEQLMGS